MLGVFLQISLQFKNLSIIITERKQMKTRSPSKVSPGYLNQDKLKIIIRMRPILNQQDSDQFIELEDDNTLMIKRPGNYTYMKFNNILPPPSSQKDVFNLVEDSIRQFLNGINITIFAYGQTGAGKTYSMIGNYSPKDSQENLFNFLQSKEKGILSRSLQMIMAFVHKNKGFRVFVSFFQIYNEKIFDLYNNTMTPLDIRQSKNGEISIPDLLNVQVCTMQEAIQYLMAGLKNRATGSTHGNAQSSRSHSIFQINLEKQDQNGQIIHSSLRIVDLAGSQKFKIPSDLSPAQKQIRIQQLTNINGSLSCLGHCISALIEKSRTHIPFRNSKLTRILSDSLLGQGKMRFIICISPSLSASAQTFSTLQFANRAKKAIFERSQMRTPHLSKKKSSQNQQITSLKRQLQRERELRTQMQKQLNKLLIERPQSIMKQNVYLRKQNEKLKQQLKQLMAKKDLNRSKSPQSSSRFNQQYGALINSKQNMTGNDLKQEMLKLPIFQNKRSLDILQNGLDSSKLNNNPPKGSKIQTLLGKQIKDTSAVPMNRKKAQFQKKIRRFIQSDSPPDQSHKQSSNIVRCKTTKDEQQCKQNYPYIPPTNQNSKALSNFHVNNRPNPMQNLRKSNNNYLPSHLNSLWGQNQQNSCDNSGTYPIQSDQIGQKGSMYDDQKGRLFKHFNDRDDQRSKDQLCEQWIQNQDTQQLIEQACQRMNLPDFKDLKSEMDRAKHQLVLLKQKDDQISRRKVH